MRLQTFYALVLLLVFAFGMTFAQGRRYRQVCENGVCRLVEVGPNGQPIAGPTVTLPPAKQMPTGVKPQVEEKPGVHVGPAKIGQAGDVPAKDNPLEDDSGKSHIVVVGSKEFHAKATAAIFNSGTKDLYHVHLFEGNEWQVSEGSLKYFAGVTITGPTKEDKTADIMHHQADLVGLDVAIKEQAGLLRKLAPVIEEKLLPDLRKKAISSLPWDQWGETASATGLSALLAGLGFSIYRGKS